MIKNMINTGGTCQREIAFYLQFVQCYFTTVNRSFSRKHIFNHKQIFRWEESTSKAFEAWLVQSADFPSSRFALDGVLVLTLLSYNFRGTV